MKLRSKRRSGVKSTLIGALGSLLALGPVAAYERPTSTRNNVNSLRGDMVRIGNDMKIVIEREKTSH